MMDGRRTLAFSSLDEVMPEVDRLLLGHKTIGNWSLAQICNHLSGAIVSSIDGVPFRFPWIFRKTVGPIVLRRIIKSGPADSEFVGVPYGSRARLILLYLQTQALKTRSREIELGRSMRDWLRRMDISQGGKSIREVKDQATRLSICKLTFFYQNAGGGTGFSNERLVDDGVLFLDSSTDIQPGLFVC